MSKETPRFVNDSCVLDDHGSLQAPLDHVADHCSRADVPVSEWLSLLQDSENGICLRCRMTQSDLYLWWDSETGSLYELERTAEGVVQEPVRAGPVRTTALLETAEAIHLFPLGSIPIAHTDVPR